MNVHTRQCYSNNAKEPHLMPITKLINNVDADAESGMWQSGSKKLLKEEIVKFIEKGGRIFAEKEETVVTFASLED